MYVTIPDGAATKYNIDLIHFQNGGFYVQLATVDDAGRHTRGTAFFVESLESMVEKLKVHLVTNKLEKP
jgi:hypothetical protein